MWLRNEYGWRRSAEHRRKLTDAMSFLLADSRRVGEVQQLARRHGYETAKRSELLWRPWLITRLKIENVEALRSVRDQGRGVVLSFMHHGPFVGIFGSLARRGVRVHVPLAPVYFESPSFGARGYSGHRDRQHLRCAATGSTVFESTGSYPHIRRLLEHGAVVALAWDLPGRMPSTFLGRRVLAASGAARAAKDTGTPIVPVHMRRRGQLATMVIGEPVEPALSPDVGTLHAELVRRHEPAVLAWPEALEWPLQRWNGPAGAD